MGLHELYLNR